MIENSLSQRLNEAAQLLPPELRHPSVLASLQMSLAEDLHPDADFSALWPEPAGGDLSSQATLAASAWLNGRLSAPNTLKCSRVLISILSRKRCAGGISG